LSPTWALALLHAVQEVWACGAVGLARYVSDHPAWEVELFDCAATDASPMVLGDVTLSSEQEQDLREMCADG
jgi:hypothetical protein